MDNPRKDEFKEERLKKGSRQDDRINQQPKKDSNNPDKQHQNVERERK